MKKQRWQWVLWWVLVGSGVFLFLAKSYVDESRANTVTATPIRVESATARSTAIATLAQAAIVYLGETHDSAVDHTAQLAIIQSLHRKNPKVAIALEMFQRPFQPVIDRYLAGDITEAELLAQSEYQKRWGYDWEYYAPILRFAKANQLPVLALNTPAEVTRKVARKGLASLEEDDFRHIPPRQDIDTSNDAYRKLVQSVFEQHGSHGHSLNLDHFFTAQVLWDETMAEGIANFKRQNPRYQVIVLAGKGHVVYGYGIPDRVSRRLGKQLSQKIVLLNPNEELQMIELGLVGDMFWFSP